jgi:hypothetical protein
MTKGQEIAQRFNAVDSFDRLAEEIDDAIAEAVSQRTVECAETLKAFCVERHIWFAEGGLWRCGYDAILALNTPAQAYPFGLDASGKQCEHWQKKDDWWGHKSGDYLISDYTHCPFCGAPRTKGS